jgi:hypothetical protein
VLRLATPSGFILKIGAYEMSGRCASIVVINSVSALIYKKFLVLIEILLHCRTYCCMLFSPSLHNLTSSLLPKSKLNVPWRIHPLENLGVVQQVMNF